MHPLNCTTNLKKVITGDEVILNERFIVECSTGDEGRNLTDNNYYMPNSWQFTKITWYKELYIWLAELLSWRLLK